MHEPGAIWNISITFLFGEFLMEYHWRPCIQLVPIFWFPIRAFPCISFWTLCQVNPKQAILCMNLGPHETFQLHFFLVSFSWSTIEDLAFNLCLFSGSPLELSMHILLDLCQVNPKQAICAWTCGHMKHFNYISFWWVSHGVPLKSLLSICTYFLVLE